MFSQIDSTGTTTPKSSGIGSQARRGTSPAGRPGNRLASRGLAVASAFIAAMIVPEHGATIAPARPTSSGGPRAK